MKVSYCPSCGKTRVYRVDTFDDVYSCPSCGRCFILIDNDDFDVESYEEHIAGMPDLFDGVDDLFDVPAKQTRQTQLRRKGGAA